MAFTQPTAAAVVAGGTSVALSQLFSFTGTSNPAYLILNALDRNEYTIGANRDTGSFSGNGATLTVSGVGGDGRGAGIVFTWQASSGLYVNATYGDLSQLTYTSSDSLNDMTTLSVFGMSSASQAQTYAADAYSLMQIDPTGYIASASVVTNATFAAAAPAMAAQATPNAIAAIAATFVGQAWNDEGCWVLASTIAAEAGASLPVHSTEVGTPGHANGEWAVIYNGPVSANTGWQNLVSTGDVIAFVTGSGGGHVTTCVSGSGSTAKLIDNIEYVNGSGVTNSAHDGSASDIILAAAHSASGEWAGVAAKNVVIYALDTPVVSDIAAAVTDLVGTRLALSALVKVADPTGRAITQYQVYDTLAGATFASVGTPVSAQSAATAVTVTSLASISLVYTQAGADTVELRAYNGAYWGDWQSASVSAVVPVVIAPRLAAQTPNQVWLLGSAVSLMLPATLFTDPQHQALTYTAVGPNGAALPSWLAFNPKTLGFSGTVPLGSTGALTVVVTATDTSGLSASEVFTATIPAALAPRLAAQTPNQVWLLGSAVSLVLPATLFADPQHEALTIAATGANGAALPGWLAFNPKTLAFSGTVPLGINGAVTVVVTATDTSGLSTSEVFTATIPAAAAPRLAAQTPNQVWQQGAHVALTLPASVFSDPQHEALTYAAAASGGAALPSWLAFNPKTLAFSGAAPQGGIGVVSVVVTATDTSGLSASEKFAATIPALAPHLASQTTAQSWVAGSAIADTLKQGVFTDPQSEALTLKASLSNGAALPSWLSFDPASATFSGTAPATVQSLSVKVTATDTSNLSVYEVFVASVVKATGHALLVADVTAPTHGILLTPPSPGAVAGAPQADWATLVGHAGWDALLLVHLHGG